jgi:UDP-N-acetylmuramate--alanine ligase
MHIYFSGIGGAGIGPLALVARQAGYTVSGSDKQDSSYIEYLRQRGVIDIQTGPAAQSRAAIAAVHERSPIDWLVYTSALPLEHADAEAPELAYCREQGIKTSKRDELLRLILRERQLELIAVAGTHGKTTTTALAVWLFKELGVPISYLLPAKTSFAEMGAFDPQSRYFVYEADEFDRNFLAYDPAISLITGVSWDHHEIFPTREDYQAAFREFIDQSRQTFIWGEDAGYLGLDGALEVAETTKAAVPTGSESAGKITILDSGNPDIEKLTLLGKYNRLDAWLAVQAVQRATEEPVGRLVEIANRFPGLQRRMEQIIPGLYSDYAHTPEKIRGAMSVATELAAKLTSDDPTAHSGNVVVAYEPLTNRRQHYMLDDYGDCFAGADKLYWIPSYLAREDPGQRVIPPAELIAHLADPSIAEPRKRDQQLKQIIRQHLDNGDMVVAMAGGGGDSLDDWLREAFAAP